MHTSERYVGQENLTSAIDSWRVYQQFAELSKKELKIGGENAHFLLDRRILHINVYNEERVAIIDQSWQISLAVKDNPNRLSNNYTNGSHNFSYNPDDFIAYITNGKEIYTLIPESADGEYVGNIDCKRGCDEWRENLEITALMPNKNPEFEEDNRIRAVFNRLLTGGRVYLEGPRFGHKEWVPLTKDRDKWVNMYFDSYECWILTEEESAPIRNLLTQPPQKTVSLQTDIGVLAVSESAYSAA